MESLLRMMTGGADYTVIQEAVDAATDGDTIQVFMYSVE